MTFEEYLQQKHAEQYQGLDDEMPDNFNEWLQELDPDDWFRYGEFFAIDKTQASVNKMADVMDKMLDSIQRDIKKL